MSVLVDFNQTLIASIMLSIRQCPTAMLEGFIRHLAMSMLLNARKTFADHGELVICVEGGNCWRKQVFPHYKANRKKAREESTTDWQFILSMIAKMTTEAKEFLPYKVVGVPGAEADDVIAVLARYASEKVMIVSSDKDFAQLQKYPWVRQWSPNSKEFIRSEDPERDLKELVLRGDRSDGIPSFLSPDDQFVSESAKSQSPITSKRLETWLTQSPTEFCDAEQIRNYQRNATLIDFEFIPAEIERKILDCYSGYIVPNRRNMLTYFAQYELTKLAYSIGDF